MRFYIIISLAILFISYNGCFKIKGGFSSHSDSRKEQPKRDEKFSYIFERRGRRNPFIGEGILITPRTTVNTPPQVVEKPPVRKQEEDKKEEVLQQEPLHTLKKWPTDKQTIELLRETYKELDKFAGALYEKILEGIENFEDLSDQEFSDIFTNIYLLYRFYYQSKKGAKLKKYTKTLKTYIKEVESIIHPVKYLYQYLEEYFSLLQKDLVNAQSKPSMFTQLKEDLSAINKLLTSPLLSIRKKNFIEFIEKIKTQTRKKYKNLERNVNLYLELYKEFKESGLAINGYIYNPDRIEDNVIFVGEQTKKVGDILWGDVEIVKIDKEGIVVNYRGERLILHFWEE